jgi:hypothetical protein
MDRISVALITSAVLAFVLLGTSEKSNARAADAGVSPRGAADNPVEENYRINESRRQDLIARQLDLNYRMIWSTGFGPRYANPFEPWPRVPGDIWGYPAPRPVEHPIGHESAQTGPNRWTYRPLYAADVAPPGSAAMIGAARPQPSAKMQLPGPSDLSEPVPANLPPAKPRRVPGPREF